MKSEARPHGQIRQSQIVTTFGPGAMVDLPDYAVIIGGLEHWRGRGHQVHEERLENKIVALLTLPAMKLYAPPIDSSDSSAPRTGITAWQFPEWFVAQGDEVRRDGFRSRPMVHRQALVGGKYLGTDRKKYRVIPVRFVQACSNGHISDIDWHAFAHEFTGNCRRQLWLDEIGPSGDLGDISVRCECGQKRSLIHTARTAERPFPLGYCNGLRPWLGPASREKCGGDAGPALGSRLLIRSASNSYFPQLLSVISIPEEDERVRKAVDPIWEDFLLYVENAADLARERKRAKVNAALEGLSDDAVLKEIRRRRGGTGGSPKSIKQLELETLLSADEEIGNDTPDGDFYARRVKLDATRKGATAKVDRVVLVHRMREVVAQVGFTRFEAAMTDINGELDLGVRRAELATDVSWLPAVENRGEGVFIVLNQNAIMQWRKLAAAQKREMQLNQGFAAWQRIHPGSQAVFLGAPYVLLHSLSHLLITAVSLECGYAASSIRERIYVSDAGSGILLYTGSPDAEGTLGGLAAVGKRIREHLRTALELGRLCSNDPVCAQHHPDDRQEERFLHGATCHGCLLIAETSCERRNEFLDRALVVPTVEGLGAEFFREEAQ
jgi:Domain of unknown function (DUF1998)